MRKFIFNQSNIKGKILQIKVNIMLALVRGSTRVYVRVAIESSLRLSLRIKVTSC